MALYDERIEFRLLFTYTHSSTHTLVVVNKSSSLFTEPMRFILMCNTANLNFLKNQWGLLSRIKQVKLSFCSCSLINVYMWIKPKCNLFIIWCLFRKYGQNWSTHMVNKWITLL